MRVFTTNLRSFTAAATVIGFLIGATGITTIVGSILQCLPIAYNWDKSTQGRCINEVDFARYTAIPNVITGFAMLLLPLPMAWRLNINVPQKIALTATFLHGIMFVPPITDIEATLTDMRIVASSQALQDSPSSAKQPEPWIKTVCSNNNVPNEKPPFLPECSYTKNLVTAISWTIWTLVEPANYIIVACLPTLRPILTRILPAKFFFLTNRSTSRSYSIVSISWPKGRGDRKVSIAMADVKGAPHMIEPYEGSRAGPPDLEANSVKFHREKAGEMAGMEAGRDINASPGIVGVEYHPPPPAFGRTSPQGHSAFGAARVPDIEVDSGVGF
ncbi:MAG: hypothetical protein Q9224_007133 [Gallowayella concinna]